MSITSTTAPLTTTTTTPKHHCEHGTEHGTICPQCRIELGLPAYRTDSRACAFPPCIKTQDDRDLMASECTLELACWRAEMEHHHRLRTNEAKTRNRRHLEASHAEFLDVWRAAREYAAYRRAVAYVA